MKTTITLSLLALSAAVAACKPKTATQQPVEQPSTAPVATAPSDTEAAPPPANWPDEPFRATRPTPGQVAELKLPQVETFKLDNGLEVYLVRNDKLPTVYMNFEFDFGGVSDPKNQIGLHSICLDLLDEGTKNLDKVAWEEKQADHAVSVTAGAGSDTSNLNVRSLKRELPAALDLLAEMLREPGLREIDFERLKDRRKASIAQSKGNPGAIAGRVIGPLLWGADHPYGRIETDKTIDAIQLKDCTKVVGKLKPGGARLWVVGQISQDEIKQELASRLPEWKGKAPAKVNVAAAKPRLGSVFFVHVKDAPQSSVYVGHAGPKRNATDYEATDLMAEILGGSFSSRINMNLREDKGYTYGGRAGFGYRRPGSTFVASSQVRTDATGPSLREISKEIATMRTTDAKPDELFRVQEGALLALPAEFDTPSATLMAFRGLKFYGLPLDWYDGYQKRLRAVDIAAVRKAAEKHLRAKDFVVLVVGDASKVLGDLDAIATEKLFGAGGVVVLDADAQPTKRPTE
ncbi:pitrilysin family protein [Nannocystis sp. ILAH1]|uniref:M16 family metallopeptidase n=1 Tax=unclassified Nannocystis TaxID=2627009 RepID=UPI002271663A|nr:MULTISPECIES: pitrilysin family protein [unclassified Nannocystis]MCY0994002.1 pitrilysin family protein [Nannocystis sp. ILAH1]MCY1066968.1 pitrilysin family protein [Nannocystis sp. RBIL2]